MKTDLPYETYRPGDTVSGMIKVEQKDGSPFESKPTFSFSVEFEVNNESFRVSGAKI